MKKTYRIVALLSILALLPLLSSCHKDSGEGKKAVETSEKSQNAVYQTKLLSVEVPKGWKFVDKPDNADSAYIYKGEKEATKCPAVVITYCDPDTQMLSPRDMYKETKDIDPVKIGDYT